MEATATTFTIAKLVEGAGTLVTGVVGMVPEWISLFLANDALMYPIYMGLGLLALKVFDRKA